ncbi:MAG: hypothetical protein OEX02_13270 [Cyclobacteriaceae bacterium]|nr:hypothetical protein [Cyclobacteriaceae bacterium]
MAFINKGKHIEQEVGDVRVRVVEEGASQQRVDFLKKLLEHNGYEVLVGETPVKPPKKPKPGEEPVEEPTPEPTWFVGVTDITFNPVYAVYNRRLRTFDGKRVTPDYWNQTTEKAEPNYWDLSKK